MTHAKTLGRTLSVSTAEKVTRSLVSKYNAYCDAVLDGSKVCGRFERLKVERQQADLKHPGRWRFDVQEAVRPLLWMTANVKFPSGSKRGKTFNPEPWQIFDIMTMFGWTDRISGDRRFIQVYKQIPRKNGKSTEAGWIADYLAFGDGYPAASVVIAANSLEQAGECFTRAEQALSLGEPSAPEDFESFNSKTYKIIKWGDCEVKAISATPRDGKMPHGSILDEYHEAKDRAMLDSLLTGNVSDANAMVIIVTTAGSDVFGPCKQEYEQCVKILEGVPGDRYYVAIYQPDTDDAIESPVTWQKANPNWGVQGGVSPDILGALYENAKASASALNSFKTKNLNIWVYSLVSWANMDAWNSLCCDPIDVESLKGKVCYAGLDLAGNNDFAAATLDFPGEIHKQLYQFFVPGDRVLDIQKQCSIPLEQWIQDGYVVATPGPIIDYQVISDYLDEVRELYDLRLIAGDKWRLVDLARTASAWFTDLTFEFSQAKQSMSPTTLQFERLYLTGKVNSGGNPVMRWMMSCAEAYTDSNSNVKLVKPKVSKSAKRIDGVIAAIMALDTAITQEPVGITMSDIASIVSFY
jgi:phage terminase large subunit-like protein